MQYHPKQGMTALCNTFHSKAGGFFPRVSFLFSGLKGTQKKHLGRSTTKYIQDFQLGEKSLIINFIWGQLKGILSLQR